MDARSLFIVVVKLYGLWMLLQFIQALPIVCHYSSSNALGYPEGNQMVFSLIFHLIVGFFLTFGTETLAKIVGLGAPKS
ncbi:MAG TPA: hypothetical protein VIM58_05785 [Candidatus Methylacidiphilales bacterium]